MNRRGRMIALVCVVALGAVGWLIAIAQGNPLAIIHLTQGEMKWIANPSQPEGPQTAVLAGNPDKPELYTMRVKIPSGFKLQPHWHPEDRMVVVISGTFHYGYGDAFEEAMLIVLPPGSFFTEPAKQPHFAWTKSGEVVVQVSGIGPSGTTPIP